MEQGLSDQLSPHDDRQAAALESAALEPAEASWSSCDQRAHLFRLLTEARSEARLERALRQAENTAHSRAIDALVTELGRAQQQARLQGAAQVVQVVPSPLPDGLVGQAATLDALQAEVGALRAQLEAIKESSSWRLLAPARTLLIRLRGALPRASSRRRPLVVLVSHDLTRSGAPIAMLHIAREMVRQGRTNVVLLSKAGGPLLGDFSELSDVTILARSSTDQSDIELLDRVLALHEGEEPRLAFCNTILTFDVAEALKARGFTVVSLVHEMPAVVGHFGVHTLQRLTAASDAVVFGAEQVRIKLAAAFGFSHTRVAVVRTAVGDTEPPTVSARREGALDLRREAGFPPDCVVVLGCGSIDHRKGVDLLIEVAQRVRESSSADIRFAWIGHDETDPYALSCQTRVASLALNDVFRFLPPRRGVDSEIAGADIFALPSREDPFPLVNVSALALGVPVVAFEGSGGAPEVIGSDAGIVVPMEDIQAYAEAIKRLAGSRDLRIHLGEGGIRRYRRELTIKSTVAQLMGLASLFPATIR